MNNTSIATGIVIAIVLIVVTATFFFRINIFTLFSPSPRASVQTTQATVKKSPNTSATIPSAKRLSITDAVVGTGAVAKSGDTVSVQYIGKLTDGKVFDSSSAHGGKPFSFVLGVGQVIKGWDEGVAGMKVGGTRLLVIPPALGYGTRTFGPIPANSTLIFEVKLLSVTAPKK